ncbi:zinc-ribbon domain-containing protein [Pseudoflavonifractor phocaeensis]|uniref:zinc-ribbon domain-containing protein n=1 Tax=Pseudoflavonifractor phocaeensis TaxID=1870988 RepID=UPI0025A35877|nr:zinc-ribbon domain-containing protein [Pseudoflavonifractor phocaeensis]MDM8237944.1 zinc-ribbon domain-containing protein [Pseudoflavonifractor phocaeensis]
MFVASIVSFVYLAVLIVVPILVGVYVFRDASRRGMNAALWTLIAVLVPILVGFIIYLLVRGNYPDLKCPQCGTPVRESYVSCPQCGTRLKASCPSCSAPVEPDWKVCPRCASPLSQDSSNIQTPVRKKDRGLGVVLAVVILVPLGLLLFALLSFSAISSSSGGAGVSTLFTDEYLAMTNNPEIKAWLESCGDDDNTAYVLRHQISDTDLEYLIYMPGLPQDSPVEIAPMSNLLKRHTLRLTFEADGINPGSTVALVSCSGDTNQELEIYFEPNRKVNCEITSVDYPLHPSEYSE